MASEGVKVEARGMERQGAVKLGNYLFLIVYEVDERRGLARGRDQQQHLRPPELDVLAPRVQQ